MSAPYIETIQYLTREAEQTFGRNVKHAALAAGEITWGELAEAMSSATGEDYSRDQVVSMAGRRNRAGNRGRIRVEKVDAAVAAFRDVYGLRYVTKDGRLGRPVDRDWFLTPYPPRIGSDNPGYFSSPSSEVAAAA